MEIENVTRINCTRDLNHGSDRAGTDKLVLDLESEILAQNSCGGDRGAGHRHRACDPPVVLGLHDTGFATRSRMQSHEPENGGHDSTSSGASCVMFLRRPGPANQRASRTAAQALRRP